MKKEDEIERIMSSWDNPSPVKSNPFLYAKISNKIEARRTGQVNFRPLFIKVGMAAMIVMVLLNVITLLNVSFSESNSNSASSIADEYYISVQTYSY